MRGFVGVMYEELGRLVSNLRRRVISGFMWLLRGEDGWHLLFKPEKFDIDFVNLHRGMYSGGFLLSPMSIVIFLLCILLLEVDVWAWPKTQVPEDVFINWVSTIIIFFSFIMYGYFALTLLLLGVEYYNFIAGLFGVVFATSIVFLHCLSFSVAYSDTMSFSSEVNLYYFYSLFSLGVTVLAGLIAPVILRGERSTLRNLIFTLPTVLSLSKTFYDLFKQPLGLPIQTTFLNETYSAFTYIYENLGTQKFLLMFLTCFNLALAIFFDVTPHLNSEALVEGTTLFLVKSAKRRLEILFTAFKTKTKWCGGETCIPLDLSAIIGKLREREYRVRLAVTASLLEDRLVIVRKEGKRRLMIIISENKVLHYVRHVLNFPYSELRKIIEEAIEWEITKEESFYTSLATIIFLMLSVVFTVLYSLSLHPILIAIILSIAVFILREYLKGTAKPEFKVQTKRESKDRRILHVVKESLSALLKVLTILFLPGLTLIYAFQGPRLDLDIYLPLVSILSSLVPVSVVLPRIVVWRRYYYSD